MDTSFVAGTLPPKKATEYFRKAAKAKTILPPEAPMKMPSTSVHQLRQRAAAELASQGFAAPKHLVDSDLLEQKQGLLIAKRKANQRISFDAHDAHRANIQAIADAQHSYVMGKTCFNTITTSCSCNILWVPLTQN